MELAWTFQVSWPNTEHHVHLLKCLNPSLLNVHVPNPVKRVTGVGTLIDLISFY